MDQIDSGTPLKQGHIKWKNEKKKKWEKRYYQLFPMNLVGYEKPPKGKTKPLQVIPLKGAVLYNKQQESPYAFAVKPVGNEPETVLITTDYNELNDWMTPVRNAIMAAGGNTPVQRANSWNGSQGNFPGAPPQGPPTQTSLSYSGYSPMGQQPPMGQAPMPQTMMAPMPQTTMQPIPPPMMQPMPQTMMQPMPQTMMQPMPQTMMQPMPQTMMQPMPQQMPQQPQPSAPPAQKEDGLIKSLQKGKLPSGFPGSTVFSSNSSSSNNYVAPAPQQPQPAYPGTSYAQPQPNYPGTAYQPGYSPQPSFPGSTTYSPQPQGYSPATQTSPKGPYPQPVPAKPSQDGLPPGWEARFDQVGKIYFIDHLNRRSTYQDPRIGAASFPPGWEFKYDQYGKLYFIDHTNKTTTYDDPRYAKLPKPTSSGEFDIPKDIEQIPTEQIERQDRLGGGSFGEVFKGRWITNPVALKMLRNYSKEVLLAEVAVLIKLRHPNIVQFLGIWTSAQKDVYIVTEFLAGGNLQDYLREQKSSISIKALLSLGDQVASGMAYLEAKNIVHRDLACRNLLCKEESGVLLAKISDFGLSREIEDFYSAKEVQTNIPVKWTAPEVFKFNKHTSKSDVWAYGITLWEIFEFGSNPYPEFDNSVTRQKVMEGYRLQKPVEAPQPVYDLMKSCWEDAPEKRPTFLKIAESIKEITKQLFPQEEYDKPPAYTQTVPNFGKQAEMDAIYN